MKILIIEDEKIPREGLFKLLKNKYSGFNILPPQENGLNGLNSIKNNKPEIILTDISMPDMNGLEMISKINDNNYNPYIIIISGYSNFEFAQTALSLGVKEYILKPFKINEVFVKIDIAIKAVTLSNMHMKSINFNNDEELNDFNRNNTKIILRYKIDYDISDIINITLSYLGKYLGNNISINHEIDTDKQMILFTLQNKNKSIKINTPTKEELTHRFDLLFDKKIIGFIIDTNNEKLDINNLLYAHNFYDLNSITYINDIKKESKNISYLTLDLEKQLNKYINSKDQLNSKRTLESIITKKIEQQIAPETIFKDLKNIIYKNNNSLSNNSINIDNIIANLLNCFDLKETMENLNKLFNYVEKDEFLLLNKTDNHLINQVLTIIEKNIYSPIFLEEISLTLGVSTEHLSRLFKEELNIGFNLYVNKRKITLAKKLLNQNNLKVSEIALKLGFSSPRYFCKVFKKIEGMTTKDFKDSK